MRTLLALIFAGIAGAAPALETARGLAAAGAPHLALARVEQLQPRDPGVAQWIEWEALRLALLVELGRHDAALQRAAELPASADRPALRQCLIAATRAAVSAGRGATARAYAARLLWQLDATAEETRAARLLVIESQLAEGQGEAAFRAMLRFEQDYRPLDRAVAERFVERLLDLGLEKEAVNWLAALDDAGPLKLRLQLKTGLVTADAAMVQARARLAKGGEVGYWRVLEEAAEKQGNGVLRIEALEQRLQQGDRDRPRSGQAPAAVLWQAYSKEAQAAANQNRLLQGEEAAWLDVAARRLGASPAQARALFAHLARNGATRETRFAAQLQLALSLYQGGLDRVALDLFGDAPAEVEALDPQVRYLLGKIAESRRLPQRAVRYWQGLAAPPDMGAAEWQVRLATVQWRAGMSEAAAVTMRALLKQASPLPDPAVGRALALGRELLGAGKPGLAEEILEALLPSAGRARAREILYVLGQSAEAAARFARAADRFLRAALADESSATDALALQARFAAATNLARAGYREDARAQYRWLLKHVKDPAQVANARRELARL